MAVALTAVALYPAFAVWDVGSHGPYARWYNHRLLARAQAAGLLGKSEDAIVPALGEPSFVWRYWSSWETATGKPSPGAEWCVVYNYAPHFFLPWGLFQVGLRGGRIRGFQELDD